MRVAVRCALFRGLMGFIVAAVSVAGARAQVQVQEKMTPVLLKVEDAPVPFLGSDGRMHLVYELWMTNFSSADVIVQKVEVLSEGGVVQGFDAAAIAGRLQPAGQRESVGKLAGSAQALLFLHVTLATGGTVPTKISHRVLLHANAAPPGQQEITEESAETTVNRHTVALIGPPLAGEGYISADSCCDASRHTRAAMPINGRVWVAQRYAVDWEQLDGEGRIYNGPQEKVESYTIFGKPVLAVADGVVAAVTEGLPEQTPGKYPTNIPLDEADGNSVILELGPGRYAMYAHMQPGSIKVHQGDRVKAGQVIGLVGNTGNSLVPHLHFQMMDRPSSLASNGLPYEIRSFEIEGSTAGTEAFDQAEAKGTPLPVTRIATVREAKGELPLDQLVISFPVR
jgi:hypothetical protein